MLPILAHLGQVIDGHCGMQTPPSGLGTSGASPGKEGAAQGQAPHPGSNSAVPLRAAPCLLLPSGGMQRALCTAACAFSEVTLPCW